MATYTLFFMNESNVVDSARDEPFASDEDALNHARPLAETRAIELWCGRRKVAILPRGARTVAMPSLRAGARSWSTAAA